MRICFLCNEYPPGPHGGIGSCTRTLARALVGAGHGVRVIGAYPADHPGVPHEVDDGVEVWRLRDATHRPGKALVRRRLFRTVAAWARSGALDLIEAPDWEGWIAAWPRLPVPVVVRANGSATYFAAELGEPAPTVTALLERAALRRADFWCAVSAYTARKTAELFRLAPGASTVLFNPIALPPPAVERARAAASVVFSGTLTEKKGIVALVRAWPQVTAVHPDAELHLFGRDGLTRAGASMRSFLASQLGATPENRVHFHGHVTRAELDRALQAARVAVFPSRAEAFALAPMEAMASGCPTIYSRRTSGPELVRHEENGLLTDPDDPGAIGAAIVRVLGDAALARRLGEAGRRLVETHFAIDVLRPVNEAYYRDCIARFAHARAATNGGSAR
ncbi:MAG: glycosyltransferase family 4 protein [Candidatus Binatia bacterium]